MYVLIDPMKSKTRVIYANPDGTSSPVLVHNPLFALLLPFALQNQPLIIQICSGKDIVTEILSNVLHSTIFLKHNV